MPKLRKENGQIAYKRKYERCKWRMPSSHPRATKNMSYMQPEGKEIAVCVPNDLTLSPSVSKTKMAQFNSVFSKATEKHHCMIIAHIYQDVLFFSSKSTWKDDVCWVQESLSLNKNQQQKIYRVFNRCEDAREKN
eukprot:7734-Ditylum_brightwellii.AAC.1